MIFKKSWFLQIKVGLIAFFLLITPAHLCGKVKVSLLTLWGQWGIFTPVTSDHGFPHTKPTECAVRWRKRTINMNLFNNKERRWRESPDRGAGWAGRCSSSKQVEGSPSHIHFHTCSEQSSVNSYQFLQRM